MKKSHGTKRKHQLAAMGVLLIAATCSLPASAHEVQAKPYTMTVIADKAYGKFVTSGRYERAITKITRDGRRIRDRFADQVNLCVAYTKSTDLEKATTACGAAIAHVKRQERWATRNKSEHDPVFLTYQRNLALAFSNRGVLFAVSGDTDRAKQDFLAAIELRGKSSKIAAKNLDRLENSNLPVA